MLRLPIRPITDPMVLETTTATTTGWHLSGVGCSPLAVPTIISCLAWNELMCKCSATNAHLGNFRNEQNVSRAALVLRVFFGWLHHLKPNVCLRCHKFLSPVCILFSVLIPMVRSGVGFWRQHKLRTLREYGWGSSVSSSVHFGRHFHYAELCSKG